MGNVAQKKNEKSEKSEKGEIKRETVEIKRKKHGEYTEDDMSKFSPIISELRERGYITKKLHNLYSGHITSLWTKINHSCVKDQIIFGEIFFKHIDLYKHQQRYMIILACLAHSYVKMNRIADAERVIKRCLALDPKDLNLLFASIIIEKDDSIAVRKYIELMKSDIDNKIIFSAEYRKEELLKRVNNKKSQRYIFDALMNEIDRNKSLTKELEDLKLKYDELYYRPGNPGALESERDFNSIKQ